MHWAKKGLVYVPDGTLPWAKTHAMIPTPELLSEDAIRIYITSCDEAGIGRIGFVDVDARLPSRILAVAERPVLDIGLPGTFDENGVLVCSVVTLPDGRKFLYYAGFEIGLRIRYRLLTGVAVSSDGGLSFRRIQKTPVLERSDRELYFRGGPFAVLEGGMFRMWYVAGSSWIDIEGKSMPVYTINYAESPDGITWPREGKVCIDIASGEEHGFGRPYVVRDDGIYRMFYSVRLKKKGYRLGCAESPDGITWRRKDHEAGIDASASGWDSEMICYSAVIAVQGRTFMFYNGNGFGKTGFGYAELVSR